MSELSFCHDSIYPAAFSRPNSLLETYHPREDGNDTQLSAGKSNSSFPLCGLDLEILSGIFCKLIMTLDYLYWYRTPFWQPMNERREQRSPWLSKRRTA